MAKRPWRIERNGYGDSRLVVDEATGRSLGLVIQMANGHWRAEEILGAHRPGPLRKTPLAAAKAMWPDKEQG